MHVQPSEIAYCNPPVVDLILPYLKNYMAKLDLLQADFSSF